MGREIALTEMIGDLTASLDISNVDWNSWERKFIEDVGPRDPLSLTTRQMEKIEELWEKL